jgi:protein TonB
VTTLRFPIAALLSALFTLGMFGGLRELIEVRSPSEAALAAPKVEFVRLKRSSEIEPKKREKVERVKPEQTPNTPTLAVAKQEGVNLGLDVEAIAAGLGAEFGSAGGGGGDGSRGGALAFDAGLADREPLPLVRVDPDYPPAARQRRLEGWVQVRFTISTAGSVKDASVVQSSHAVFEKSALQAVSKWKYQPQLVGGKPAEAPNRQVRVHFKLEG